MQEQKRVINVIPFLGDVASDSIKRPGELKTNKQKMKGLRVMEGDQGCHSVIGELFLRSLHSGAQADLGFRTRLAAHVWKGLQQAS